MDFLQLLAAGPARSTPGLLSVGSFSWREAEVLGSGLCCPERDPPGPRAEPVSSVLAGEFLTTGPPGEVSVLFLTRILFVCFNAYNGPDSVAG